MGSNVAYTLLKYSAEPDVVDTVGRNSLHLACKAGHTNVASILIRCLPALVSIPDGMGKTALHYAVSNAKHPSNLQMLTILLESSADPAVVDHAGKTVIQKAAALGNAAVVKLLQEHSAKCKANTLAYPQASYHNAGSSASPYVEGFSIVSS